MTADRLKPALDAGVAGCAWILQFNGDGRAEAGAVDDLPGAGGAQGDGFVWAHLDRADTRAHSLMADLSFLTDDARAALGGAIEHQYVEQADALVFGAIVDHVQSLDGPTFDSDYLRFALGPGFLITARRRPLHGAEATRVALARGATAATPVALFETIVSAICDCTAGMMRAIAADLDRIEDNVVLEGRGRDQRGPLGFRRREVVRLARQISGLQSTLLRLEEAVEESAARDLVDAAISLAQRADALARDVANLQDRSRMLLDEINAILTMEANDRLYMLTVVTALLLPATFVTGFFGMNTKNLFFSDSEHGTLLAALLCLAVSIVALVVMRRMGLTQPGDGRRPDRAR